MKKNIHWSKKKIKRKLAKIQEMRNTNSRKGIVKKATIYPVDRDDFITVVKKAGSLSAYAASVERSLRAIREYMKRFDPPIVLKDIFPNDKSIFVQELQDLFIERRIKANKKAKVVNANEAFGNNAPFDVVEDDVPIEIRYCVLRLKRKNGRLEKGYVFDIKEVNQKAKYTVTFVFNKKPEFIEDIEKECVGVLVFVNKTAPFTETNKKWEKYKHLFVDVSVIKDKKLYSKALDLSKVMVE